MFHISGVLTAAYDTQLEWLIVKGIADFADGEQVNAESWELSQGGNLFWRFIPFYVTVSSEVMSELHRIYSYPHDLANLWDRLEDLKYNNVNWNRCMWGSPNLNQRFSSPGASYDDQSSTQIKRGMSTAHTSQQTESTTQQHFAGISNNALNCVS